MKISKSKKRNISRFFLSFIISLLFILCLLGLFYVYIEAEDSGMSIALQKKEAEVNFIPYDIFDLKFYLLK